MANQNQTIFEMIDKWRARAKAIEDEKPGLEITPPFRGAVVGHFNRYLGGDGVRRALFGLMFAADHKPMSSKDLRPSEVLALTEWIGAVKDDATWVVSSEFVSDCAYIRGFYGMDDKQALIPNVSIFDSHCSQCGRATEHLYLGYRTSCLVCFPELDYRKKVTE